MFQGYIEIKETNIWRYKLLIYRECLISKYRGTYMTIDFYEQYLIKLKKLDKILSNHDKKSYN